MDEFLEALLDADFMFFVDDLDAQFQHNLIRAQHRPDFYVWPISEEIQQ